jgi:hypothetical protein
MIHTEIIHPLRHLSVVISDSPAPREMARLLVDFCTKCNRLMAELLELGEGELHCCIKVLEKNGEGEDCVRTWARSEPFDGRSHSGNGSEEHRVTNNSVWSALMGRSDGHVIGLEVGHFDGFHWRDEIPHGLGRIRVPKFSGGVIPYVRLAHLDA